MKSRHVLVPCALVVAALLLHAFWPLSAEEQIARAVADMCELASSTGGESDLTALSRARQISASFSDDCELADSLTGRSTRGRQSVTRSVAWARAQLGEVSISATSFELQMLSSGVAELRLGLEVLQAQGPAEGYGQARVTMTWALVDERWQVVRAAVVRE